MGQPVTHWQIITNKPDKLADFYAQMFEWKINADNPMNYRMVDTGSEKGIQGGIWPAPPEANGFVQLHVEVGDVGASVKKAESLGATVLIPPQTLPDGGQMAVIKDPDGIPLALTAPAG